MRNEESCRRTLSAYLNEARPRAKPLTPTTAMLRYITGGCSEAREMSQAEVANRDTPARPCKTLTRSPRRKPKEFGKPSFNNLSKTDLLNEVGSMNERLLV
jgi:hypothetical protein